MPPPALSHWIRPHSRTNNHENLLHLSSLSCSLTACSESPRTTHADSEKPANAVQTIAAQMHAIPLLYTATGIIHARTESQLASQTLARVLAVKVHVGDHVAAGSASHFARFARRPMRPTAKRKPAAPKRRAPSPKATTTSHKPKPISISPSSLTLVWPISSRNAPFRSRKWMRPTPN